MIYDNLRELKEKQNGSCVSFVEYNNIIYFAVNGCKHEERNSKVNKNNIINDEDTISKILERMYPMPSIQCKKEDAVTIIDTNKCREYKLAEKQKEIFDEFDLFNEITIDDYVDLTKYDENILSDNWSCCERKILGYLNDNKIINISTNGYINNYPITTNVVMHPCPLCMPLVSGVNYLDKYNNIKHEEYITTRISDKSIMIKKYQFI